METRKAMRDGNYYENSKVLYLCVFLPKKTSLRQGHFVYSLLSDNLDSFKVSLPHKSDKTPFLLADITSKNYLHPKRFKL